MLEVLPPLDSEKLSTETWGDVTRHIKKLGTENVVFAPREAGGGSTRPVVEGRDWLFLSYRSDRMSAVDLILEAKIFSRGRVLAKHIQTSDGQWVGR